MKLVVFTQWVRTASDTDRRPAACQGRVAWLGEMGKTGAENLPSRTATMPHAGHGTNAL